MKYANLPHWLRMRLQEIADFAEHNMPDPHCLCGGCQRTQQKGVREPGDNCLCVPGATNCLHCQRLAGKDYAIEFMRHGFETEFPIPEKLPDVGRFPECEADLLGEPTAPAQEWAE